MFQVLQVSASLMVLLAFALLQLKRIQSTDLTYLLLNIAGGCILAVQAYQLRSWGFLLLEAVWTAVAAIGVLVWFLAKARQSR